MKTLALLLLLVSTNCWSLPQRFEVWFLSVDKVSWLDRYEQLRPSTQVAQRSRQCQPMGEYCFDPQIGLYKKNSLSDELEMVKPSLVDSHNNYQFMPVHAGQQRDMINCDETQLFDIFCGEQQKKMKQGKSPLEIWVDVSSTMKQVDFDGFENECKRERFLRDLNSTCPLNEKMKVYYFDEFRKEAGSFDRVCLSSGLNNMKRLLQDLNRSQAESVIIITDIFEADEKFISSIERLQRGTIRGLKKPFYPKDLKQQLAKVRKLCL